MGFDVETTLEASIAKEKQDSAGGQLPNAEDELQARCSITHWTDTTSSSLRVVTCQGFRAQLKISGIDHAHRQVCCGQAAVCQAVPRASGNQDRGLHRRLLGIE